MRLSHLWDSRRLLSCCLIIAVAIALAIGGCAVPAAANEASSATATSVPTATPTPQPPCTELVAGATPLQTDSDSGVPGLQAPAGTYIGPPSASGGGAGQYTITSYTLCFQGNEANIDGGQLTPSATPTSTIGYLVHGGWKLNNLFPDPTNFAYLDYCSNARVCVNSSGSGAPFTFVGFDQYASHTGGYTTFRLQVGTIANPNCLNDAQYYSGTPKYTIYEDGSTASSTSPTYHFLMPPGTRVSTYLGGGTAGSSYAYFCSAGTQATIVNFLKQALQNDGYAISYLTASGFHAETGSNPTYSIDVSVSSPGNYYLRIFVPI